MSGSDAGRHGGDIEMPHHLVKAQSAAKQRNVGRGGVLLESPAWPHSLTTFIDPLFGELSPEMEVVDVSSHPFLHMCQKGDTNR